MIGTLSGASYCGRLASRERNCAGVTAWAARKAAVKWLWLLKPHSWAICATGISERVSRFLACSSRVANT
ncbi:hypothetical protein PCLA_09r0099 [Pseudomonas citronellolis]|nr:hypothetical protein PCLA_09r0099 [Pseudomonas citronellolis]